MTSCTRNTYLEEYAANPKNLLAEDFVRRLRAQAAYCAFEHEDREIMDRYIDNCPDAVLKDKLVAKLSRGPELTLETVLDKARVY